MAAGAPLEVIHPHMAAPGAEGSLATVAHTTTEIRWSLKEGSAISTGEMVATAHPPNLGEAMEEAGRAAIAAAGEEATAAAAVAFTTLP